MTKLKLSDIKYIIESDYSYAVIVDYLRFFHVFGRGTKVSAADPDLMVALQVETPAHASQKMVMLFRHRLVRREVPKHSGAGRIAYLYYLPK